MIFYIAGKRRITQSQSDMLKTPSCPLAAQHSSCFCLHEVFNVKSGAGQSLTSYFFLKEKDVPTDEAGDGWDAPVWQTDCRGEEKSLHLRRRSREVWHLHVVFNRRPNIHKSFPVSFRLSAANPSLSEQSVRILLERGLVQVEGGTPPHSFNPCFGEPRCS